MELLMSGVPEAKSPPDILEIAALVQRTLAGDSAAFEGIIVRYERRVLMLSLTLLGSMEDAQDAAQEVYLRPFKRSPCRINRRTRAPDAAARFGGVAP